jgi:hypothetical protein
MYGRLGLNIPEGQNQVIFVNNISGNLPPDNFAKNGFAHNSLNKQGKT